MGIDSLVLCWRDFLGGLFGGLRGSVSVSAGEEMAESCFCFFCCRFSLRLWGGVNAIAESASLRSGVEREVCGISGSSAGMWDAVGLATCARVVAFECDMPRIVLGYDGQEEPDERKLRAYIIFETSSKSGALSQ